jgi:hypothetical protein
MLRSMPSDVMLKLCEFPAAFRTVMVTRCPAPPGTFAGVNMKLLAVSVAPAAPAALRGLLELVGLLAGVEVAAEQQATTKLASALSTVKRGRKLTAPLLRT